MIMTSGIMITTQSKNITSPQNNTKLPSTNMHTTLKQYSRVRSTTNYEGDDIDLEMEMVLMMVMVKMVLKTLPPTPRRSW